MRRWPSRCPYTMGQAGVPVPRARQASPYYWPGSASNVPLNHTTSQRSDELPIFLVHKQSASNFIRRLSFIILVGGQPWFAIYCAAHGGAPPRQHYSSC
ncbi:hypothetical protein XENTR_v10015720 [Xenopus tropicalis]|nr:hypothetical protein XENTR_v10015720 [Xenopus tropicalis]